MYGKHDGISQEAEQKVRDAVLEMHKKNIKVDTIASCVKFTINKVKEIITSSDKLFC